MTHFVPAFRAALDAHNDAAGLELGNSAATDVWHLLRSALEFCDENGVNFHLILEEVWEDAKREAANG